MTFADLITCMVRKIMWEKKQWTNYRFICSQDLTWIGFPILCVIHITWLYSRVNYAVVSIFYGKKIILGVLTVQIFVLKINFSFKIFLRLNVDKLIYIKFPLHYYTLVSRIRILTLTVLSWMILIVIGFIVYSFITIRVSNFFIFKIKDHQWSHLLF